MHRSAPTSCVVSSYILLYRPNPPVLHVGFQHVNGACGQYMMLILSDSRDCLAIKLVTSIYRFFCLDPHALLLQGCPMDGSVAYLVVISARLFDSC